MSVIPLINHIADQPDPTARVKTLLAELLACTEAAPEFLLDDLIQHVVFLTSAIVSGGHVHTDLSIVFEGKAAS
jgi:hypothetical protein